MKPQGSFTGSSAWLLGRAQSDPADRMLQRVRMVTNELQAIQNEMCAHLAASDGTPRKNAFTPDSAAATDLNVFKTVVDQMRRMLWFYTGSTGPFVPTARDLTETVAAGKEKLQLQSDESERESGSFFERLNVVIDGYIQTNAAASSRRTKL
jgi:hypothetical protein